MRTLAIVNQKGGSGKTTTAINIAAIYAARGHRTLLVDMDPQSHCSAGLGVPDDRIDYSIGEAMLDQSRSGIRADDLLWEVSRNLDLAPSTMRLAGLEAPGGGLHELEDKDRRLLGVLRAVAGRYDRCVIDCPPTIGILTYNAMRAAREALIPVETGYLAMKGAKRQWETIKHLIDRIDRSIAVHVLPTIHDPESRVSCDVLEALRRHFAGQIVPMVIHRHEELRESVSFGQPIIEYAPDGKARLDYERLVEWLEDHLPTPGREQQPAATTTPRATLPSLALAAAPESLPPLPTTARVMQPAEQASFSPSSRAAEMVRRVQDMARRTSDRGRQLDELVKEAVGGDEDDRPAIISKPAMEQPSTPPPAPETDIAVDGIDFSYCADGRADVQTDAILPTSGSAAPRDVEEVESLDTIARSPVRRDRSAGMIVDVDSMNCIDSSPRRAAVLTEVRPIESEGSSASSHRHGHLYGVRQTARGVLFAQPASCGRMIAIAGQFNGWSPTANPLRLNPQLMLHEAVVPIEAGTYEYRLVIDGKWQPDPYNARRRIDQYGDENSIITVMRSPEQSVNPPRTDRPLHEIGSGRPRAMTLETTQASP